MRGTLPKLLGLYGLIAFQPFVFAEVPERLADTPMALAFGAPPTVGEPMLSPDGDLMVFVQQNSVGATMLRAMNLEDGSIATLFEGAREGFDINACLFANATRVLCDMELRAEEIDGPDQRFMAVDTDGTGRLDMAEGAGCDRYDPLRGELRIDRLPDDREQVMFFCDGAASLLDIYTGEVTATDAEWLPSLEADASGNPVRPVGYGSNRNLLFNIAWDDDTEAWSLFRLDRASGGNQLVFAHGATDVELVDTMGRNNRVVAAVYVDGRVQRAIIDRRVADVYQYLSELLPDLEAEIIDESWDQSRYLARVRSPVGTGELLLVDMDEEVVQQLGPEFDHLTGFLLAETTLFQIDSSTGGGITVQLTRPYDVAGPVPTVIVPRSAVTHRAVSDPDYLVQFLAASGYAVLQVGNRVDAERGAGWLPSRLLGGADRSADDLLDAARFMIENGFSESDAICGIGKDYGAYAALTSAVRHPDLFRCVVGISAVTDDTLIASATELDAPTLLFHGANDRLLDRDEHAVALTNALLRANKDVVLVDYPNVGHDIRRGLYRADMLARTRAFLAEQIGPPLQDDERMEWENSWRPQ